MNSENGKTSDPYTILLFLAVRNKLKKSDIIKVTLPNLSIYFTLKKVLKIHMETTNVTYQGHDGMKKFNYLMVCVQYQTL